MNIAVNTRLLLPGKLEGLGRFSYEVLNRITKQHPEHRFTFIFDRKFSDEFVFSNNVQPVICHPQARHPILWYMFFDWGVPSILQKTKANLFFSPDGWLSLRTNVPSLPVIHDLNFFHNPEWIELAPRMYYKHFFPRFVQKAARIATVSEFSQQDIINKFQVSKELVDVVYNGSSEGFKPLNNEEKQKVKEKYSAGKDFFLFVGLVHPRKNLKRILEAFDLFKRTSGSNMKLMIVGSTKYMSKEVKQTLEVLESKNDVILAGRVPDSELKKVTASALAQIYASLFEGFGIPILEAMACDTPVVTSNTSAMAEVGGDAVRLVDPYSVDSIKEGMVELYSDNKKREQLIERARIRRQTFSWDKTAELVWKSIEKTIK